MHKHTPQRIALTKMERESLVMAADNYLEGIDDAKDATAEDPSVESAEQLAHLSNSLDNTRDALLSAKKKLGGEKDEQATGT